MNILIPSKDIFVVNYFHLTTLLTRFALLLLELKKFRFTNS